MIWNHSQPIFIVMNIKHFWATVETENEDKKISDRKREEAWGKETNLKQKQGLCQGV